MFHEVLEGRIVDFKDFIDQRTLPYNDISLGTLCSGDAVGNGAASAGKYQGPASEANVIRGKVLCVAAGNEVQEPGLDI
ncbi:hypothetical protein [Pseudalkalibacillus caeni]|uniref:Uncharacterized protein n=1 Tax=Exobacillus caeni TaxID=2574798 RepID=A0A5R9F563_9BACL|nr:hypothetical protein [Pseudalkalibacillus caeni]TLS37486.1 hypothetical protein FCL54_10090 [Pseudalkalibacillus caeni]